jgi:aryl-alcohol dehydrogenase-like predicted oxidoreductase/enamine deaminase RidA (YjgF/YER057c/UK114 family)
MTLPRVALAPGLEIPRIVTGLWQVADQERSGTPLDTEKAADALEGYAAAGFDAFDMADHYGSAELIVGRMLARGRFPAARAFTKWVPTPGPMTAEVVKAGIDERRARLGVEAIDLLQFHWWHFRYPGYIDAFKEMTALKATGAIRHLGVTNFDTDHLRVLVKHGFEIATNQVSFSLLDRRAAGEMSAFCQAHGVKLLAYGTLGGGFLTERWLGRAEPSDADVADWSKMKYGRFIRAMGGWAAFQRVLAAVGAIARKHGVSIANVANRWVLDHPAVGAIIVGARLGEREHRADSERVFAFALDGDDHDRLAQALGTIDPIPGDCGDEYRKPPFLTASGDLSHHLDGFPPVFKAVPVDGRANRLRIDSGSVWEPICGYSRAVRVGDRILVSGTTATHGSGEIVCPGDVAGQTVYILDKIEASITSLGGTLADVVRTRVYLTNADDWEPASRAHGRYFGAIRPANTLLEIGRLVGRYAVEIEAEAVVG